MNKLVGKVTWTYELAGFDIGFTDDLELVPEKFQKPIIQVEFEMNIPWLLVDD